MNKEVYARDENILRKIFVLFAVLAVCIATISCTIMSATAAKDDDDKSYSFYKVASAAASYYDDSHNAAGDNGKGVPDGNIENFNKAGAYIGFIDQDYDTGFFGATVSFLSSSSQSRGYGSFGDEGVEAYVQYGNALAALGLDSTANSSFDIAAIIRLIGGILLAIFYLMALSVEAAFSVVATILQALNPFRWFGSTVTDLVTLNGTRTGDAPAPLGAVAGVVSDLYGLLNSAGLALIVVLFVFSLGVGLIAWKGIGNIKSTFRKFITRLVFIVVGIPAIGVLYTATLNNVIYNDGGAPMANQIVSSVLVDFESWAQNSRLALPNSTHITVNAEGDGQVGGSVDMSNTTPVKRIAQSINAVNTDALSENALTSGNFTNTALANHGMATARQVVSMLDIISRYTNSTFYHASDFETYYKQKHNIDTNSDFAKSFEKASDIENYKNGGLSSSELSNATYLALDGQPGMTVTRKDGDKYFYMGNTTFSGFWNFAPFLESFGIHMTASNNNNVGLSPLSMYNYLTTEFSSTSVTTHSSHKLSSKMVAVEHRSVNLIGTGLSGLLYYLNTLVMLLGLTVIGFGYAIGMLMSSIGRGIRMITSVPFALLGNLRAMAKVTTYGAMMIIEVLGTMLAYSLVIQIYIGLDELVTGTIAQAVSRRLQGTIVPGVGSVGLVSGALLVGLAISIIVNIWFIAKMMKLRKIIVKTLDEYAANVIDRVFNVQNAGQSVANAPTAGDKVRSGLGRAAGALGNGVGAAVGMYGTQKAMDALGGLGKGSGIPGISKNVSGADGPGGAGPGGGGPDGPDGPGGGGGDGSTAENAGGVRAAEATSGGAQGFEAQSVNAVHGVGTGDGADGGKSGNGANTSADEAHGKQLAASVDTLSETPRTRGVSGDSDTGKQTSASDTVSADQAIQQKGEEKRKAKAEAVKGAGKAVVGAGEVAAGVYTGNAHLVKDGAQRVVKGGAQAKQGHDAAKAAKQSQNNIAAADAMSGLRPTKPQSTSQSVQQSQQRQNSGATSSTFSSARPAMQQNAPAKQSAPVRQNAPARQASSASPASSNIQHVGGTTNIGVRQNVRNSGMSASDVQRLSRTQSSAKAASSAASSSKDASKAATAAKKAVDVVSKVK